MSFFGCCSAPKAKDDEFEAVPNTGRGATASFSKSQGGRGFNEALTSSLGSLGSGGSAVQRAQPSWSQSWSQLNNSEAAAVQQTLAKVRAAWRCVARVIRAGHSGWGGAQRLGGAGAGGVTAQ